MKQGQKEAIKQEAIKRFDRAITVAFGNGLQNEERFRTLYDSVKSPDESDGLPPYGGDQCAIKLMLYLREQMRKCGLAPKVSLKQGEKRFYRFRMEGLRNTNTVAFKYRFPETWAYDCEERNPNRGYKEDGWDYQIVAQDVEQGAEWLEKFQTKDRGVILTHFYYNELDHYLTHLVGAIRGYSGSATERGYQKIESEIEKYYQSSPSAEASEWEMHSCV